MFKNCCKSWIWSSGIGCWIRCWPSCLSASKCAVLIFVFEIILVASVSLLKGTPSHSMVSFAYWVAVLGGDKDHHFLSSCNLHLFLPFYWEFSHYGLQCEPSCYEWLNSYYGLQCEPSCYEWLNPIILWAVMWAFMLRVAESYYGLQSELSNKIFSDKSHLNFSWLIFTFLITLIFKHLIFWNYAQLMLTWHYA